jgi:hypothetical protein
VKRRIRFVGVLVGLVALTVPLVGITVSGAADPPTSLLAFDDAAQQVTLTVPTPPCAPGQEGCKWVLFVNEPKLAGKPVVGSVTGTAGVLTVKYPPNFCGVLQADARTGPPYIQVYGLLHTVKGSDCAPPPTPTSTTAAAPTTTTTASGPLAGSAQPPTPPSAAAAAVSPPMLGAGVASTLPTAEPATASGSGSGVPAVSGKPTQLPFTGASVKPLMIVGLTLVALGLFLVSTNRSRRRVAHWLGNLVDHARPPGR